MPRIFLPVQFISPLTKSQQLNELNSEVRCKIAPSKIDGVGVFTIRDIKRGERLYCTPNVIPKFYNIPFGSLSKLFPEVRELVMQRWPSTINGSAFQSPNDDAGLLFFMNHSDDPNYDLNNDTALRDIKNREEVTENYKLMQNWEKVFPWLQ